MRVFLRTRTTELFFLFVTVFIAPCALLFSAARRLFNDKNRPVVLVVQSARIGDMVCVTPVFREIKKAYPRAQITSLVAEPAFGVTRHNPYIDHFVMYEPSRPIRSALRAFFAIGPMRADYSLNFFPGLLGNALPFWLGVPVRITATITQASRAVRFLFWFSNRRLFYQKEESAPQHHLKLLAFLGVTHPDARREVFENRRSEEKVQLLCQSLGLDEKKPNISISVGCGKDFRKWPLGRFIELINWIRSEYPANILLVGGEEDARAIQTVMAALGEERLFDVSGKLDVVDLPSLFRHITLFVSVSTGPLYIADAAGCATIDIIGTDSPDNQMPQGNTVIVQRTDYPSCSYVMYPPVCSRETLHARMDIPVAQVKDAVKHLLSA